MLKKINEVKPLKFSLIATAIIVPIVAVCGIITHFVNKEDWD